MIFWHVVHPHSPSLSSIHYVFHSEGCKGVWTYTQSFHKIFRDQKAENPIRTAAKCPIFKSVCTKKMMTNPESKVELKQPVKVTTQRTLTKSCNIMKRLNSIVFALTAVCACATSGYANILVDDTWLDSTRTDPAAPVYAENNGVIGTDADADGNLESAWFKGGSGTMTASPNDFQVTGIAGSTFWTTYFTPQATPVTLANAGDAIKITWVFTPTGVAAANTSQGFNMALVQTPSSVSRLTADGSAPSGLYAGYAMFMNMGTTLGNANPFNLKEWTAASAGSLLGTAGNWGTSDGNGATSGNTGFADSTQYTFVMTLTRTAATVWILPPP